MELNVLQSKNGTLVVFATELYHALELPKDQYGRTAKKWIKDVYDFNSDIRTPECYRDYARRPRPGEPIVDYYLSLELARKIALHSNSKMKARVARYILRLEKEIQLELFPAAA